MLKLLFILFSFAACFIAFYMIFYSKNPQGLRRNLARFATGLRENRKTLRKKFLIIAWTDIWGQFQVEQLWTKKLQNSCGPVGQYCTFSSNRSLVDRADAVLWYGTRINRADVPKHRKSHQRYVFFCMEPPQHTPNLKPWADFFNWTMSYRRDSDVFVPYGYIHKKITSYTPEDFSTLEILRNKTKLVAWFVGQCRTAGAREVYVKELQKYISVDIYGRCGDHKHKCPRTIDPLTSCEVLLNTTYKFYISFENAVCRDYITEKFWQRIIPFVVPVVLRRSEYIDSAPMDSFIAVDDFTNAKSLADYLLYLDNNVTAYAKYFEYRRAFESLFDGYLWYLCPLCKMLHESNTAPSFYHNLHDWYHKQAHCIPGYGRKFI